MNPKKRFVNYENFRIFLIKDQGSPPYGCGDIHKEEILDYIALINSMYLIDRIMRIKQYIIATKTLITR